MYFFLSIVSAAKKSDVKQGFQLWHIMFGLPLRLEVLTLFDGMFLVHVDEAHMRDLT